MQAKIHLYYISIFLVFGVLLYDLINFKYTDEILIFSLVIYAIIQALKGQVRSKNYYYQLLVVIAVFIFYLIYSFVIKSNTNITILTDFIIQLKPFLAFYCILILNIQLTKNDKAILKRIVKIASLYLLIIFVFAIISGNPTNILKITFGHPSRYATATTIVAFLYLWLSNYSKKSIILSFFIICLGLLSLRSKHYGIVISFTILTLYYNRKINLNFSLKSLIVVLLVITAIVFVSFEKIQFYFIEGSKNTDNMFARPALYLTSLQILKDYIPFGSGLATYATYASTIDYSPTYIKYGLDNISELSPEFRSFLCDTFYPSLAQFGIFGVMLFITFWGKIINTIKQLNTLRHPLINRNTTISLLIVIFFLIESTSDSTFTHNRGAFMLILLALQINELKLINKIIQYRILIKQIE